MLDVADRMAFLRLRGQELWGSASHNSELNPSIWTPRAGHIVSGMFQVIYSSPRSLSQDEIQHDVYLNMTFENML